MTTLIAKIAQLITAIDNCEKSGNQEWKLKHQSNLELMVDQKLPSGSGFDRGTEIDLDKSTDSKVVFNTSFHHMDKHGYYGEWLDYVVTVIPTFGSVSLKIKGKNLNNIKDHIYETFYFVLMTDDHDL